MSLQDLVKNAARGLRIEAKTGNRHSRLMPHRYFTPNRRTTAGLGKNQSLLRYDTSSFLLKHTGRTVIHRRKQDDHPRRSIQHT